MTPISELSPPGPAQITPVSLERFRHRYVNVDTMNTNSNSFDSFLPKIEADFDNDSDSSIVSRLNWTPDNTMKLIKTLETTCPILWNSKHSGYKDKVARQMKMEYLADMFGTTVEEISRKLHNLRSQYNNELRKIKKKQGEGAAGVSVWDYFEALSFLRQPNDEKDPAMDPLETVESVNIELAEFQAEEEEVFGAVRKPGNSSTASGSPNRNRKKVLRVAASAPPPLPARAQTFMWSEKPSIQPGLNADECQIFGDFVASELRTLRSSESRKKLKRMIQKAILEVGEEEDGNMFNS